MDPVVHELWLRSVVRDAATEYGVADAQVEPGGVRFVPGLVYIIITGTRREHPVRMELTYTTGPEDSDALTRVGDCVIL
jgi:hypothetical protein